MQTIFDQGPDDELLDQIFLPNTVTRLARLIQTGGRFVHYTSAEVAMSIIQNAEFWMRNARTMNDWSEVEHGLTCVTKAWASPAGDLYRQGLDAIHAGISEEIATHFDAWIPDMRMHTYLTCVSEHPPSEDALGRLSMWRAYGGRTGVALVMNVHPFTVVSDALKAYSSPVAYETELEVQGRFASMAEMLTRHQGYLRTLGRQHVHNLVFETLRFAVLCTKHPAFAEEKEWRIIYAPSLALSPVIKLQIASVRGVPQIVQKIPLKHSEAEGLYKADLASLLDRVLIGPCEDAEVVRQALIGLLARANVPEAASRVHLTGIPLRQG